MSGSLWYWVETIGPRFDSMLLAFVATPSIVLDSLFVVK